MKSNIVLISFFMPKLDGRMIMKSELEIKLQQQSALKIQFRGEFIGHMKMVMRNLFDEKNIDWQKNNYYCLCYIPTIMGRRRKDEAGALPGPLPDVCTGFQINEMLTKIFLKSQFESGAFAPIIRPAIPSSFEYLQLDNAYPQACIFALNPFQFVIDTRSLGDIPKPTSWKDLLNPIYKGKICINGTKYGPDLHVLAWVHKKFGKKGVIAFRNNIADSMHASRMSREIGSSQGYPVCIMNRFFSLACNGRPNLELVWPEEGAVCQPIWVMARAETAKDYKPLYEMILGKEIGQIFADNGYISLAEDVIYKQDIKGKLDWFGWDYVLDKNFDENIEYLRETFCDISKRNKKI